MYYGGSFFEPRMKTDGNNGTACKCETRDRSSGCTEQIEHPAGEVENLRLGTRDITYITNL